MQLVTSVMLLQVIKGIENIQPFLYHFYDMSVGICHNGNLINAKSLRQNLEKQGAIFHSSSDTEVIMHLIRRSKAPTFEEALKKVFEKLKVVLHLQF